jgi:phosphoglucosamine mutase
VARLFGTDGVRGLANIELTADLALALSRSVARLLAAPTSVGTRPTAVVGRDPRPSGELLDAAVCAGLASAGIDVRRLGVVPTAAVAHLVRDTGAAVGVMITASHNPMPDNGIKFFGADGFKLTDEAEDAVEAALGDSAALPTGAAVGRMLADEDLVERYAAHLLTTIAARASGVHVVVDAANGAATRVLPEVYERAGARVTMINDRTDGEAINEGCGATHLDGLRAAVVEHGADLGLAHDGDADRCLAVDHRGEVVDGDAILAVLALSLREGQGLARDTVVATVMSNLGFHKAMKENGIAVAETAVGDRYVLERMRAEGLTLGGEQSGHVILLEHATTGDGILTGLHLLSRVAGGSSLAELAAVMTRLPQVLLNVGVPDKSVAMQKVQPLVLEAEAELAGDGRVLVRPSGTEQLVRVMVEAPTADRAQEVAERIASGIR